MPPAAVVASSEASVLVPDEIVLAPLATDEVVIAPLVSVDVVLAPLTAIETVGLVLATPDNVWEPSVEAALLLAPSVES